MIFNIKEKITCVICNGQISNIRKVYYCGSMYVCDCLRSSIDPDFIFICIDNEYYICFNRINEIAQLKHITSGTIKTLDFNKFLTIEEFIIYFIKIKNII